MRLSSYCGRSFIKTASGFELAGLCFSIGKRSQGSLLGFEGEKLRLVQLEEVEITNGAGLVLSVYVCLMIGMFAVGLFTTVPIVCRDQDKTEGHQDNPKDNLLQHAVKLS